GSHRYLVSTILFHRTYVHSLRHLWTHSPHLYLRRRPQQLDLTHRPWRVGRTREIHAGVDRSAVLELDRQHLLDIPPLSNPTAHRGHRDRRNSRSEPSRKNVLAPIRHHPVRCHARRSDPDLLQHVRRALRLDQQHPHPHRDGSGDVEEQRPAEPPRDRDDGELALDGIQRAHPPRGHASRAPGPLRGRRARRAGGDPPILFHPPPQHPPDDDLRDHHRHDRRSADLH